MNLALKYRPRRFEDVIGQKAPSVILSAMISQGKLEPVLLFTGPSGVGKTSMARIVAGALNPGSEDDVHNSTHPLVLEIDAASNGSVEAIRNLKTDLSYAKAGHYVVIIDEVHAVSNNAFDALKDMLEFPAPGVTFILCTTEEHKIEEAIRHRCDRYVFKKASVTDLLSQLRNVATKENINVSTELLDAIAHRSEGSFRESLMMLNQVWSGGITTIEDYNELHGEIDFGPGLIASTLHGPSVALNKLEGVLRYTNTEEVIDRTVETLRDLILIKGGLATSHSDQALVERKNIAKVLSTEELVRAIKIVWDLQTKLGQANPVRGLEMAYAMMGEILKREQIITPKPAAVDEELSFEEMQRLTGAL